MVIVMALFAAAASCGGGGDEGAPPPEGPGGFSPLPPPGAPPGGDPEEQTPYFTGDFTLPGGANYGDLRGVAVGRRYVYVADTGALYCFDKLGNFVNVVTGGFAGWTVIQAVNVIPPDPMPEDGDETRYPFPDYPVINVNPFTAGTWGGIAVIYAPNLDDVVTIEQADNPYAGLKFYPLPRIADYVRYGLYPCTPLPDEPGYLPFYYTYDMDVTREGAIVGIYDIDPDGQLPIAYPQVMIFFDPHEGYLVSPNRGREIFLEDPEGGPGRTLTAPFFWEGFDDGVGALGQLAFANVYPQSRTDTQRLYVQDYTVETDFVGFNSLTVDKTIAPFTYSVGGLAGNNYGYWRIIGIPAGSLPGSFSWGPPLNPDGGLEDPDLDQGGPSGMGVDPKTDNLYVCDPGNRRIQIFDPDGFYIGQIGDGVRGTTGNHLVAPSDLTIALDGTVFVCDTYGGGDAAGLLRVFPSAPSQPLFGSVGGFVYNAGITPRVPIANAVVSVSNANGPIGSTETNIMGEYRFQDLPVGEYYLVASKVNYTSDHTSVDLVPDETVLISFNLYPREAHTLGSYVGAIYDEVTRLPINNVTIRILPTSMTAISDEYGKFNFDEILAGNYQAEFRHERYATLTKDVVIVAGQTTRDEAIYLTPLPTG